METRELSLSDRVSLITSEAVHCVRSVLLTAGLDAVDRDYLQRAIDLLREVDRIVALAVEPKE